MNSTLKSLLFSILTISGITTHGYTRLCRTVLFQTPATPLLSNTAAPLHPPITILIHGTRLLKPLDTFFRCIPDKGLNPVAFQSSRSRITQAARSFCSQRPNLFNPDHFYTFGWDGDLDKDVRSQAGNDLYQEIKQLTSDYIKKYQTIPTIRILSHSHGGNAALNMARYHSADAIVGNIELVLLACPVQQETAHYTKNPLFKKIYSFYSSSDFKQIADPQAIKIDFYNRSIDYSKREFPASDALEQYEITINKRGLFHPDFIAPRFTNLLPSLLSWLKSDGKDMTSAEKTVSRFYQSPMLNLQTA